MTKKYYWSIFLLLGLIAMMIVTKLGIFIEFEYNVTKITQSIFPHIFDVPFSLFSLVGSSEIYMPILGIIGLWFYVKFKKIFYGLWMIFVVYFIELLGKNLIYHPGPPEEFFRYSIPFYMPSAYIQTVGSFPSGHVSRAFFLLIILIFLNKKLNLKRNLYIILNTLYIVLALVMLVSRVYLGEHWFSDTIGGVFLGTSIGLLATMMVYDKKASK